MGKFNWRAGVALASHGLRQDRDEKRAYERQDRETAQRLYADMLEQGMDVPDISVFGPEAEELAKSYREQIPKAKQRKLDAELETIRQTTRARAEEAAKVKREEQLANENAGMPSELAAPLAMKGVTYKQYKTLSNYEKRSIVQDYSSAKRKPGGGAGGGSAKKAKLQLYKGDDGGTYEYNFDTGESKLIRGESPEKIAAKKAKIEKDNKKLADETYTEVMKMGVSTVTPSILESKNALLEGTGWQIRPVYSEDADYRGNLKTVDYKLKRLKKEEVKGQIEKKKTTFTDDDIKKTAASKGMAPEAVKAALEAKGLTYVPAR